MHDLVFEVQAPIAGPTGTDTMATDRLKKRLCSVNAILELLDLRRMKSGDEKLGMGMEKRILDAEMLDLERTMAQLESAERTAIRDSRTGTAE
jgi:hypothetical protein